MDDSVLTDAERRFLQELDARGVRFLVVGLTAATLQGANTSTVDVDLWFETPTLGGSLGDRFDVVLMMSGLDAFEAEYARSREITVEGARLRVLPLDRILASKRAAGRPKDLAVIPALEEALAALDEP